jgi:hypothetical protein
MAKRKPAGRKPPSKPTTSPAPDAPLPLLTLEQLYIYRQQNLNRRAELERKQKANQAQIDRLYTENAEIETGIAQIDGAIAMLDGLVQHEIPVKAETPNNSPAKEN